MLWMAPPPSARFLELRSAYFADLGLLTIRDRDDASVLDASSARGADDADSST
jgi:hypothetical protein